MPVEGEYRIAAAPAREQVLDAAAADPHAAEPGIAQHAFEQPDGAAFDRRHRGTADQLGRQLDRIELGYVLFWDFTIRFMQNSDIAVAFGQAAVPISPVSAKSHCCIALSSSGLTWRCSGEQVGRVPPGCRVEWPTWVALAACYTLWGLALAYQDVLGWWFAVPGAVVVAFHSSLQHEVLHGHPTRSSVINEALVFLSLGLVFPYRRFRDLHMRHHNDERLTDPYDDPGKLLPGRGRLDRARAGRCAGCAGSTAPSQGGCWSGRRSRMWGFWRSEARLMLAGDRNVQGAWLRHALGRRARAGADLGVWHGAAGPIC